MDVVRCDLLQRATRIVNPVDHREDALVIVDHLVNRYSNRPSVRDLMSIRNKAVEMSFVLVLKIGLVGVPPLGAESAH